METRLNKVLTCVFTGKDLQPFDMLYNGENIINDNIYILQDFEMIKKKAPSLNLAILKYRKSKIICIVIEQKIYFYKIDRNITSFKYTLDNFFYDVQFPALSAIVYICWYENFNWLFKKELPFSFKDVFLESCFIGKSKKYNKKDLQKYINLYNEPDEEKFFSYKLQQEDYANNKEIIRNKQLLQLFLQTRDTKKLNDIKFIDLPYMLICEAIESNDKNLFDFTRSKYNIEERRVRQICKFWPDKKWL